MLRVAGLGFISKNEASRQATQHDQNKCKFDGWLADSDILSTG